MSETVVCDAFGLFGPAEDAAHTIEGGAELPVREVDPFARIIRPALPA